MKEFLKQFRAFVTKYGFDVSRVFDDFLQYVIWLHTLPEYGKKIDGWGYTPQQNKEMFELYRTLISEMKPEINHKGWFDAFGYIYEDMIAGKFRRSNSGQFFTPPSICNLMTEINAPKDIQVVGKLISDPTCGSGRNLLAFHAIHVGNRYIAEDIDKTCCLMTACNFILHGVEGDVIWHDSLQPETFYGGWRTNEQLNQFGAKYNGIPHVREITYEDSLLKCQNDKRLEVIRIRTKLEDAYEKQLAMLRQLRQSKSTDEDRRHHIRQISIRISKLKKLIKKYD